MLSKLHFIRAAIANFESHENVQVVFGVEKNIYFKMHMHEFYIYIFFFYFILCYAENEI